MVGLTVEWDENAQTVTITGGTSDVKITLNSTDMLVNGRTVKLDVAAKSINGRTLIPVRAISRHIGSLWRRGQME